MTMYHSEDERAKRKNCAGYGRKPGIGAAIALSLATAGADVVLNFHTRAAEAQAVEAEILRLGRRCVCIQADVSVASEVRAARC